MSSRIIFSYVNQHSGHKVAADAVQTVLKEIVPEINTVSIDSTAFYPALTSFLSKLYIQFIKTTPEIWGFLWDNKEIKTLTKHLRNLFYMINSSKIDNLINEFNPDVIVTTHALPAIILSYKKNNGFNKPVIGIITDYTVHTYWINNKIDLYIVPNEEIAKELEKNYTDTKKIRVAGIPVRPEFLKDIPKDIARSLFGLKQNKFTVMIMGGTYGLLPLEKIIEKIIKNKLNIQILAITGKNQKIYIKLKRKYHKYRNVNIFGYIKNVNVAMDASDLLITKPGGITITEAIIKKIPMLIINPIPGQELKNTKFLLKNKLSEICSSISDIPQKIDYFMSNNQILSEYKKKLSLFARPYSAYTCAEIIKDFIGE